MRIFLLRHGRTPSNQVVALDTAVPGAHLDEVGRAQAEAVAETLAARRPAAVYASTLTRAQQTAAPLATRLGLDVEVRDGLREIDAGHAEMRNDKTAVETYFLTVMGWVREDVDVRMPGGITGREFLARFDGVVDEVHGTGLDSAVLVAHGAAIRTWVALRVADPQGERFANAPGLNNTGYIEIDGDPRSGWRLVDWQEGRGSEVTES